MPMAADLICMPSTDFSEKNHFSFGPLVTVWHIRFFWKQKARALFRG